jgi:Putative transposase
MTLDAGEFIRRFLIHVLPKGFHHIRHYGLFASANRAETIARVRELLGLATPAAEAAVEIDPAAALAQPCPAVGAACSSSRPSMPATNHATGRRQ